MVSQNFGHVVRRVNIKKARSKFSTRRLKVTSDRWNESCSHIPMGADRDFERGSNRNTITVPISIEQGRIKGYSTVGLWDQGKGGTLPIQSPGRYLRWHPRVYHSTFGPSGIRVSTRLRGGGNQLELSRRRLNGGCMRSWRVSKRCVSKRSKLGWGRHNSI